MLDAADADGGSRYRKKREGKKSKVSIKGTSQAVRGRGTHGSHYSCGNVFHTCANICDFLCAKTGVAGCLNAFVGDFYIKIFCHCYHNLQPI